MALLINDPYGGGQEDVRLGSSKITPRETYGVSAEGIRSQYSDKLRNVDSLVSSLSTLNTALTKADEQSQQIADARARATKDLDDVRVDKQTGGVFGSLFGFLTGERGPSPTMRIALDQDRGTRLYAQTLNADKEYQEIISNPGLMANRDEFIARLRGVNQRLSAQFFEQNPQYTESVRGGWATASRNTEEARDAQAMTAQINEIIAGRLESAERRSNEFNSGAGYWRSRAHTIAKEVGVDPAEVSQFIAVENPRWDPNAVSPTGVRGLAQITTDRFNMIKENLAKTNPELAARLKDRGDGESSLIALTVEYPRLKNIASTILGREAKTAETYLIWNLGERGAAPILNAIKNNNLDVKVADVAFNISDVNKNAGLYGKDGSRTIRETLGYINQTMKDRSSYHQPSTPVPAMKAGVMFDENTGIPTGSTVYGYKWSDFKNSGVMGGSGFLDSRIVQVLDQASQFIGYKIMPMSGHRTGDYQAQKGIKSGAHGPHTTGTALDISVTDPEKQLKLARFFSSLGVKGIGVYGTHMHIDLVDREASWSKDGAKVPIEQLRQAIAQGRTDMANGGSYRPAGFNGTERDPYQSEIAETARRTGLTLSQVKGIYADNLLQTAREAANTGDYTRGQNILSDAVTNYGSNFTTAQRNSIYDTQRNMSEQSLRAYEFKKQELAQAAEQAFRTEYARAQEAFSKGQAYFPDQSKFNLATPEGQAAYGKAKSIATFGTAVVDRDVSTGNLGIYRSKFNDQGFMSELGAGDGKELTKEQFREAALKRFRGELTLSDLNTLVDDYDKHRTQTPIARAKAEEIAATQRGTLQNLLMMDDKYTQAMSKLYQNSMDPQTSSQKVAMHVQMLQKQYENVFSYWYMQTMQENGGQPPSGKQLQDIMKITMETVKGDAASMSLMLFANSQQNMREGYNPQLWAERQASIGQMFDPTAEAQKYIPPDAAVERPLRVLPEGSRVILDQTGKPAVIDGAYQYRLPNGTVVSYDPVLEAQMSAPTRVTPPVTDQFRPTGQPQQRPAPRNRSEVAPTSAIPTREETQGMAPAERSAVIREATAKQNEEIRGQLDQLIEQRIKQSEQKQFTKDVARFAQKKVEAEFADRIRGAASRQDEQRIIREIETRFNDLTNFYEQEYRPIYDAFIEARRALDAAPPSQRELAKRAFQRAREAWAIFNEQ